MLGRMCLSPGERRLTGKFGMVSRDLLWVPLRIAFDVSFTGKPQLVNYMHTSYT